MAGKTLTSRERWVEEGLAVLAGGGCDAVRIEVLAKRLGVTKGGFYGHFKDRDTLLGEMLATWEREAVDDVLAAVANESDPKSRARRAGILTFSSDRLLPLDLAIRDWARRDPAVAERLRRVDDARMNLLREAISTFCDDPEEVEARSLLAFCAAIGAHFLAVDHGDRTRQEVLARAADLLLENRAEDAHR
ncbi:TetR/AcrR family transcriptional regulator [Nocardiopsis sp. CNT-189]|uniref:TetR/AcrR family transcriptional regulator n=1 Tax=Nocardiopsis oceanisediminis TaxID=2816862 RepID=UPI003B398148